MRYIISTLGCKVNQYESQAVETLLQERGFKQATENEVVDLIIVNTCAVTAESGRKSRQTIHALKDKNPNALVAVCGCYSQLEPEEMEKIGIDIIYGSADKGQFIEDIVNSVSERKMLLNIDKPFERRVFEDLPSGSYSGRTRAMLKIQDGCVNFCTYCIIPYTRGRLRSLPIESAIEHVRQMNAEGYKEIVLTGIEIASYGVDLPGHPTLTDIVEAVAKEVPEIRIRLGSIEPTVITEDLCERLSKYGNICRHFHLSLQSGNSTILKAMNRKYDAPTFIEKCNLLRKYFPGCALTADLIVGFPGETEELHAQTLAFLKEVQFSQVHVFPYSRRPGTPADEMPNQISNKIKARRAKEARDISEQTKQKYLEGCIGKTLPVLFETQDNNMWQGHTDTYVLAEVEGENLRGLVKNVKISAVNGEKLVGIVI